MTIKETMAGQTIDTLGTIKEAVQSGLEWLRITQELLQEEQRQGLRNYRSELVKLAEAVHTLNTGYVQDVQELNELVKDTGVQFEAV